jgi:ABC-type multidrug transport system ATPase subunit
MIVCENLNKIFTKNTGIYDINLNFMPGIIYGIIGYNGAGKTTLLRCIEGLYLPTSGNIMHNKINTKNENDFINYRKNISFLPSDEYLYSNLTCNENIELATILRTGHNKLTKNTLGLIKYFDADSFLNRKFKYCSTGMKKKIQLIISLIGNINTIIWDEPNDGLDIVSNIKLKNILNYFKEQNITILFSSHVIEFLSDFIDYCILIQKGRIIEQNTIDKIGSLDELLLKYIDKDSLIPPFML